jgi:hypothetical protein
MRRWFFSMSNGGHRTQVTVLHPGKRSIPMPFNRGDASSNTFSLRRNTTMGMKVKTLLATLMVGVTMMTAQAASPVSQAILDEPTVSYGCYYDYVCSPWSCFYRYICG